MPVRARIFSSRRGSVLILVIVLLLLLAILGTAFLSASRGDREVSLQTVNSNQTDQYAKGLASVATGLIVGDLQDFAGDPPSVAGTAQNFAGYTHGQARPNPLSKPNPMAVTYPNYSNPAVALVTNVPYHSTYLGVYSNLPVATNVPVAPMYINVGDVVSDQFLPPNYWVCINSPSGVPGVPAAANPNWKLTTPPNTTSDTSQLWLADRTPSLPAGSVIASTGSLPFWQNITQQFDPVSGNATSVFLNQPFESPDTGITISPAAAGPFTKLYPSHKSLGNTGALVPTLDTAAPSGVPPLLDGVPSGTVIGADADGDGIADSYLFRIPGATFDGLTWYAGMRIIDNNSAINANTAYSRDGQMNFSLPSHAPVAFAQNYWGIFPSNVGLVEMLALQSTDTSELQTVAKTQMGGQMPSATPYDEPQSPNMLPPGRNDFNFISMDDLWAQQLARRLANPGFVSQTNTNPAVGTRFNPFPYSDTAALAYHFTLLNPSLLGQTIPPTMIETNLSQELYTPQLPSTPYNGLTKSGPVEWFNLNFTAQGAGENLRSLLVTRNPVANYINPVYDPAAPGIVYATGSFTNLFTTQGEPLCTAPLGLGGPTVDPLGELMLPYGPYVNTNFPIVGLNHYRGAYDPNATNYQFNDIVLSNGFTYICVAPLGTAVPNHSDPATIAGGVFTYASIWQLQPYTPHPVKANVNTATFRELFRAFWNVMAGNPARSTQTAVPGHFYSPTAGGVIGVPLCPFGDITRYTNIYDPPNDPAHMFRSPLRDPTATAASTTAYLDPGNVAILRAALAAVNTMGLRDNTQNVISRTIALTAVISNTPTTVHARVYSNAPQPFITEVFADNFTGDATKFDSQAVASGNPDGYIAVELHNPYSVPLNLTGWQIGLIPRDTGGSGYPSLTITQMTPKNNAPASLPAATALATIPPITIPAHGYAVLENFDPTGANTGATGQAQYRPSSSGLLNTNLANWTVYPAVNTASTTVVDVPIPYLYQAITTGANGGCEIVILRPRRADGTYSSSLDPLNSFDEGSTATANLGDMVPVDSYDFTGFPAPNNATGQLLHYMRYKGAGQAFNQVYPGRYNAPANPRQEGTITPAPFNALSAAYPIFVAPPVSLGVDPTGGQATYTTFAPIQIYNVFYDKTGVVASHFPNPVVYPDNTTGMPTVNPAIKAFPFGTFARNGDMLDIPYIGAYRITNPTAANQADKTPTQFLELNSLPMDCAFADDGVDASSSTAAVHEHVGRFCPQSASASPATSVDFYFWTRRLFDYLTVESTTEGYFPNFDPGFYDNVSPPSGPSGLIKYPVGSYSGNTFPGPQSNPPTNPTQVYTSDPTATDQTAQDTVGVDGKININTASVQVLNMLPLVAGGLRANAAENLALAKAIVTYRTTNGPFASIYDLNRVPGFQTEQSTIGAGNLATPDVPPGIAGFLAAPQPGFPRIAPTARGIAQEDYQGDFAELTRISNLITTRSDTYTVYIVLEGWQNAVPPGQTINNNAPPSLKVTRRFAFIADRSAISGAPGSFILKTINVPND